MIVWTILMLLVIQIRHTNRISMGDGGIQKLATRIRGHSNFIENTPLFLLLLAFVELGVDDIPQWVLYGLGFWFVFGRILHGIGFSGDSPSLIARIVGTASSMTSIICLAMYGMVGWNIIGHILSTAINITVLIVRAIVIPFYISPTKSGKSE